MSSITKPTYPQGPSMRSSSVAPPVSAIRPRLSFQALNLRIGLLRFIALGNGVILLSLLWALLDPVSPLGILAPLSAFLESLSPTYNTSQLRFVIIGTLAFLLCADISQSLRRLPPSYASLVSLSGQALLFGITFLSVLAGRLPMIALYGIGTVLLLSIVGTVMVVRSYQGHGREAVRALLYPTLSVIMLFLGLSLILSPDSVTRELIEGRYGMAVVVGLLLSLAWGSGQLRQNHLTPDKMARRLMGMMIFPFFSIRLLALGQPISLLGVALNIMAAALALFCAFVQAEIERVSHEQDAQALADTVRQGSV